MANDSSRIAAACLETWNVQAIAEESEKAEGDPFEMSVSFSSSICWCVIREDVISQATEIIRELEKVN